MGGVGFFCRVRQWFSVSSVRSEFFQGVAMYVCVCSAVTEDDIRRSAEAGAGCLRDLVDRLGICMGCGKCWRHAQEVLDSCSPSENGQGESKGGGE